MYRVFLGAPTASEIKNDPSSYSWRTLSSSKPQGLEKVAKPPPLLKTAASSRSLRSLRPTQSLAFPPPATLEAASRRISLIYQDIVFNDQDSPEEEIALIEDQERDGQEDITGHGGVSVSRGEQTTLISWPPTDNHGVSVFRNVAEQTTMISWPPSRPVEEQSSVDSFMAPSFLLDDSSRVLLDDSQPPPQTADSKFFETQDPESQSFGNYSDASSIARFPSFHFNLHGLTSLTRLSSIGFKGSKKVDVLLAILEVEGPDTIRIKKGADAGNQVSIFKMVLSDDEGTVCKLIAWREIADEWGGNGKSEAAKRGDIVHIENVTVACDPKAATTLTASPYLKSQLVICYRTMPYAHEDRRLRPDLRLGISEPSVRKVASMVAWFEEMAGLAPG